MTFRLHAPNVSDVKLWGEWILKFLTTSERVATAAW